MTFVRWTVGLTLGAIGLVFGLIAWGFLEAFDRITPVDDSPLRNRTRPKGADL